MAVLVQTITLALAVLGAVLGVLNTWNAISQRQLRLKVIPAHAISTGGGPDGFAIEVINLSAFPVTLIEIGFVAGFSRGRKPRRIPILDPLVVDQKPWPRRLEARESVSLYFNPLRAGGHGVRIGDAYALTACNNIARGTSPALRQLRAALPI